MKYRSRAHITLLALALFSSPLFANSYITKIEGNGGSAKDIYWYYLDKPVFACHSVKTQDRNVNSVLRIAYLTQRPVQLTVDPSGCTVIRVLTGTP
jgi:hypothetical protein